MQLAPETVEKLQNAAGFGFDHGLHHQLPALIQDGDHNGFLVHVHSDIFDVITHLSCLLGGKVIRANACLSLNVKCHASADLVHSLSQRTPAEVLFLENRSLFVAYVIQKEPKSTHVPSVRGFLRYCKHRKMWCGKTRVLPLKGHCSTN